MGRPRVYPDELRQRAVRLVREWQEARAVSEGGYTPISKQLGIRRRILPQWAGDADVEDGTGLGQSREKRSRIAEAGAGEPGAAAGQ